PYYRRMGQQNTEIDIESLQKSGRRRGGCLDVFLVLSIIFLFVAVAAVAVGGLMVVKELRSKLETARPSINVEALNNFIFDPEQSSLKPKRVGTYFIYIDFNLTCTHICPAGLLTVSVGDKLTCEVQLPAVANSTPVSKKCWTVSQISDSVRLVTQMTVPNNGLGAWKLELSGSGFGMCHFRSYGVVYCKLKV
uniref:Uncharacterized protein n=1 Tax=Dicentrarchus labrax TaxID=13489 RepID=A0A8P4KN16_DICLA